MAFAPIRRTRFNQPSGDGIDWFNPLTRGLLFASANGMGDSVTGKLLTEINSPGKRILDRGTFSSYLAASSQYKTLPIFPPSTNAFSFFALVTFDDTATQRAILTVTQLSSANRLVLYVGQTANKISLNSVDSGGGSITATSSLSVTSGKTYAVGGTYSFSDGLQVFVNGELVGTGGVSANGLSGITTLALGARYNASWGLFGNVAIACPCVWTRKLSAAEFRSLSCNPWQVFL